MSVCASAYLFACPRAYLRNSTSDLHQIFTARCYACAVYAMAEWLCVCVTSRCSTKTAEHRITQTKPHESSGTLVFWCQRSPSHPCTLSLCITPELGDEAEQVEAEYGQVEEHDADELDVVLDEPVPRLQRVSVRVALGRRTWACEAPDQRQTHHRTGLS